MIYTQRIFWPQYNTVEKLHRLLEFLKKHHSLAHEISFFTEGDGKDWRFLPPAEVERRALFLKGAVETARAEGFIPVINLLNTMGHSDEGGDEAPQVPWQGIVDMDGTTARVCSCPADERFLDYVRFKYEAFARCRADRYWIDDDVRMDNHSPVRWGCFCPACLEDFSRRMGTTYSRSALTQALHTDRSLRKAWVARNAEVFLNLLRTCAEGVFRAHPGAEIGLMTGDACGYTDVGIDLPKWFHELTNITGGRGWLRAGGGFWNDSNPRAFLNKAHSVANTISRLPAQVGATYEVENYPFILGAKSAAMTGLECLVTILSTRLDGIMFDVLDLAGNSLDSYSRWTKDLEQWVPLWNEAAEVISGTIPLGWQPVYSNQHFQNHAEEKNLLAMLYFEYKGLGALQLAGVPVTGFSTGAGGYMLEGSAALGMSGEELEALLEKPLIMDGVAARRYFDLGMGERIGLLQITERSEGAYEVFSDHSVNGTAAGYIRAATLKYFGVSSYILQPAEGVSSLSTLTNYQGEAMGSALTLYQPQNGAPVAVIAHMPWMHVLSPQRMEQMRNLSRRMLGDFVPIHIESDRAVALWYRRGADGREVAVLFNAGFDPVTVSLTSSALQSMALATPGVVLNGRSELYLPGWAVAVVKLSGFETA